MEKWDIVDENRVLTGKVIRRGDRFEPGEYHTVVHICVFNSKGEMLIQQRQPFKEGWSNLWDVSVGGSAISGETSRMAAERELKEELGIDHDFSKQRPVFTINARIGFDDYYTIEADVDPASLKLQEEEVQTVKFATLDEILELIEECKFIPYYPSLIRLLFEAHGRVGAHTMSWNEMKKGLSR